ncbi:MAG: pteridine reductase [Xanthomonadaceae bacterium]|nr:pteridine reductase [Xanthomonadaceae bacterium]
MHADSPKKPDADSAARPVALITGAARRIGAGIARRLHADGYDLLLHYRESDTEMRTLAAELNATRADSVDMRSADLADARALAPLVDAALERFGRLDALINNASLFAPTPLGALSPDDADAHYAVNARAPLLLAQAAAPHLRRSGGAIVNIADIYAERPLRQHIAYCMSKAALVAATRALALELAPEVRVNAVAPGAILWPDGGKSEEAKAAMLARTPLARIGETADIAEAVRWLLRDARYTTGQVLRVDGGRMLEG